MTILDNMILAAGSTTGTSVLTEGMKTAMNTGIADLTATFNDVIGVIVPAALVLIAINAGVNFALGKIRGLMGWAQ